MSSDRSGESVTRLVASLSQLNAGVHTQRVIEGCDSSPRMRWSARLQWRKFPQFGLTKERQGNLRRCRARLSSDRYATISPRAVGLRRRSLAASSRPARRRGGSMSSRCRRSSHRPASRLLRIVRKSAAPSALFAEHGRAALVVLEGDFSDRCCHIGAVDAPMELVMARVPAAQTQTTVGVAMGVGWPFWLLNPRRP